MRIGIGGGAFGVRGGISNKGFGVGAGPVSLGSSWGGRRRRRSSNNSGGFFGFVAALLLIAWPYLLGTYVAVQLGAANPSTTRSVCGWVPEIIWLALLAILLVGIVQQRSQQQAALAEYHAPRAAVGPGSQTVFRHGACTVNHRTPEAATNCRKG
ncbi:hypothetical protein JCM12141A_55100 [Mycolicibacterium hodleri]